MPPESTQSAAVEGVTQSREMVQASFQYPCGEQICLSTLPRLMAARQRNIYLFVGTAWEGKIEATTCLSDEDSQVLRQWADGASGIEDVAFQGVGLVSVFPHRFSLKTAGLALMALAKAGIPVHGFCSSLSALTFITPFPYVEKADAALRECFNLPGGS